MDKEFAFEAGFYRGMLYMLALLILCACLFHVLALRAIEQRKRSGPRVVPFKRREEPTPEAAPKDE